MNIQSIKPNPFNKILVVGHSLSGYQDVETLLNTCGMNPALPSRRDGFLPAEISATLCKAHRIPAVNSLHAGADIEQVDVGPIWHGMALDLLLGNIDQEFWGWADPQSIYFLDYWKSLDPQIAFVLVYDTPQQLVAQAFDGQTPLTPEALQQATRNWSAFNAALLHFYHRNPERCLLVHAQHVRESASTYLQQMRTRIGAPVLADRPQTKTDETADVAQRHAAALPQAALKAYIASALIQQHPDTLQLYEELQSVANLPLSERVSAPLTPLDAWASMMALQSHQTAPFNQVQAHTQAQEAQVQALSQRLSSAEALAAERLQHIERLEQSQTTAQQRIQEQRQENQVHLLHLHQVQEEIERHHLEGQPFRKQLAAQTQPAQAQAGKIKNAAAKPSAVDLELKQENELLLLQLHQVQEELEGYYLKSQKFSPPPAPASPSKLVRYGAADRVKRQLSYRLGAAMIAQSRTFTGWLTMPWALLKQARDFEREKKARGDIRLPPLKNYYDAHEAEKVKQHLSYRLGAAMITNSRTPLGWLKMPWALQREVLVFKNSRGK